MSGTQNADPLGVLLGGGPQDVLADAKRRDARNPGQNPGTQGGSEGSQAADASNDANGAGDPSERGGVAARIDRLEKVVQDSQRHIGRLEAENRQLREQRQQEPSEPEVHPLDDPTVQKQLNRALYGDGEVPEGANAAAAFKVIADVIAEDVHGVVDNRVGSLEQMTEKEKRAREIEVNIKNQLQAAVNSGVPGAEEIAREFMRDPSNSRLGKVLDDNAVQSRTGVYNAVISLAYRQQGDNPNGNPAPNRGGAGSSTVGSPAGSPHQMGRNRQPTDDEQYEEYANARREAIINAEGDRPSWL